jgi:hypothetical protein
VAEVANQETSFQVESIQHGQYRKQEWKTEILYRSRGANGRMMSQDAVLPNGHRRTQGNTGVFMVRSHATKDQLEEWLD